MVKKKFKKGTDTEFMSNPIEEWIQNKTRAMGDDKGELKYDIEIEVRRVK